LCSLFWVACRSAHLRGWPGGPVLSAGELFFLTASGRVEVIEASNQSTGYCPEPESWPAVAAALDRAGIAHPAAGAANANCYSHSGRTSAPPGDLKSGFLVPRRSRSPAQRAGDAAPARVHSVLLFLRRRDRRDARPSPVTRC